MEAGSAMQMPMWQFVLIFAIAGALLLWGTRRR
jgi:hypothetical protein